MLVLVPGKVVDTVHVSPVDNLGEVISGVGLPRERSSDDITVLGTEVSLLDTAATGGGGLVDGGVITVVGGLGELVDSEVVEGIVLLSIGSLMHFLLGPGVLGGGPGAIGLNVDVVGASADAEETFLAPVFTPRVSDHPELLAILFTVTNDGDIVNDFHGTSVITVDATGVALERVGNSDTASNGTSLGNFLHHVLLAGDLAELVDTVHEVLVGDEASLTGVTVTADVHGGADLTVVKTTAAVDGASLIGDLVLGHPLEGVVGLTTVATKVGSLTRDDDLGGDVDIGPGGVTSDLDSIGKSGGGGVSPA